MGGKSHPRTSLKVAVDIESTSQPKMFLVFKKPITDAIAADNGPLLVKASPVDSTLPPWISMGYGWNPVAWIHKRKREITSTYSSKSATAKQKFEAQS